MKTNRTLLIAVLVTLLLFLSGCTSGTRLSSKSIAGLDTGPGTYNLILYGGQNARDLNSIAILDRGDDSYTIVPYGAPFNYRIVENLSAAEATERGERFINDLYSYRSTGKRTIHAPDNTVIGYELRPLFMPLATGLLGDIVDTTYVLQEENRVLAYVGFRGFHQDPLFSTDTHFFWGH